MTAIAAPSAAAQAVLAEIAGIKKQAKAAIDAGDVALAIALCRSLRSLQWRVQREAKST